MPRDGEPQSHPLLAHACQMAVDLHEGLEDLLQLVRRDPSARVVNGDRYHRASVRGGSPCCIAGDRDGAILIRELAGIREHVEQNLLELFTVGAYTKGRFTARIDVADLHRTELRC